MAQPHTPTHRERGRGQGQISGECPLGLRVYLVLQTGTQISMLGEKERERFNVAKELCERTNIPH